MTHTELTGVLVALVTPFTADGSEIDADVLEAHVERLIREGVHGFVPGGSTGEFTTLSLDERKQLTELVVKAAAGRVPVVAGTGALSTQDAVDLAAHAAQAGADALMVVPPFYDAIGLNDFKELLREIYAASQLPIMFYNIPSATGLSLVAVKGDLIRGRELWAKIYPICRLVEKYNYAAAVKTGLDLTGYPAGPVRKPFALLEGEDRAELGRLLRAAGVEVVD